MTRDEQFHFEGADGARIAAYRWLPPGAVRAVLQVAHGMGEHALRYRAPLQPLIDAGIAVYANDHRGHGASATRATLGDFGAGGFDAVVDDMARLTQLAKREQPGKPIILLGHSMGSFAAQIYFVKHGALIDGLVLSGTAALDLLPPPDANGGLEAFNAPFEPARTKFDWLSRDPAEVDKYIADPLCGFTVTPVSMASIFAAATVPAEMHSVRKDLPIYVFVGDHDPINGGLAWLTPLVERYRAAGVREITCAVYEGGRHEMLNEINRAEVVRNLLAWSERAIAKARKT
jgi:alpha-beta hydrolase superfamily lysophospholipase